jgi:hypothetical protein
VLRPQPSDKGFPVDGALVGTGLFFPGELIDFGDLQLHKVREKVFESPDFYI